MKNRIFIGNHYLNLSDISHVQFNNFGGCDINLVGGQNVFLTGANERLKAAIQEFLNDDVDVEELHND